MGFMRFISNMFTNKSTTQEIFGTNLQSVISYKEMAIQTCITFIANALASSDIITVENGEESKNELYYIFNISPNSNQNASEFWHEVVEKLVYKNEVLIIENNGELLIADSFDRRKKVLYPNKYINVVVDDYTFPHSFVEEDVYYFTFNNSKVKEVIDRLYADYSLLIDSAAKGYKRMNGRRGILNIDARLSQQEGFQEKLDELINKKFKKYYESQDAVLTLTEGYKYEESKEISNVRDSRDIKNLIDDIYQFIASAFHVPINLLKGDTVGTEEQINTFLMFCLNPLCKMITREINRKNYGREMLDKKTYVKIDTQRIKHVDMQKLASACDIFFRIGVNSVNDNLRLIGREIIEKDWANEHHVTKNYQSIEDIRNEYIEGVKNNKKEGEGVA